MIPYTTIIDTTGIANAKPAKPMVYKVFVRPLAAQLGLQELVMGSSMISPQPTRGAAAQNTECTQAKRINHLVHFWVKVSFAR